MIHDNTLIEKLAALEHEQWMTWAKTMLEREGVTAETRIRWTRYMFPYEELPDDIKEYDRLWARKVIEVINNS